MTSNIPRKLLATKRDPLPAIMTKEAPEMLKTIPVIFRFDTASFFKGYRRVEK
jgi:hypothetical protein